MKLYHGSHQQQKLVTSHHLLISTVRTTVHIFNCVFNWNQIPFFTTFFCFVSTIALPWRITFDSCYVLDEGFREFSCIFVSTIIKLWLPLQVPAIIAQLPSEKPSDTIKVIFIRHYFFSLIASKIPRESLIMYLKMYFCFLRYKKFHVSIVILFYNVSLSVRIDW